MTLGAAMPNWLRVSNLGTVNQIVVGGVNRLCTLAVTPTQFQGCPAAPAGGIAAGTVVTARTADGFLASTTITPAVAAGATTYTRGQHLRVHPGLAHAVGR